VNWFSRNQWWLARIGRLPVDVVVFATIAFFLVRLLPGDPVVVALSSRGTAYTEEEFLATQVAMGLDGSLWDQFVRFWAGAVTGDLGTSLVSGLPVVQEVLVRLPSTVELILLGLGSALVAAIALGFLYIRFASDRLRNAIRTYASFATSVPVFVVAIIGIVVFYVILEWLPAPLGRVSSGTLPTVTGFPLLDEVLTGEWVLLQETLTRYILPVGAMVVTFTPNLLTQLIGGLDRELEQTTTRFQVAAGVPRRWIYFSVFRRSLSSVVVIFGLFFGGLIGGAVTVESLFGFGGLGALGIQAVEAVDFPTLQGFLIIIVAFCLVAFFVVDLVNMWLDPRRRPGVMTEES
jgi:ABC-type dipeptide/oligopeptide/nickel transport system permease component